MIAHLVRKYIPLRVTQRVACPRCRTATATESHVVIYCLVCGQAIPLPPVQAA